MLDLRETTPGKDCGPCLWERRYQVIGGAFKANFFRRWKKSLGRSASAIADLVTVLELARVEAFVKHWPGLVGRPRKDRAALARSFVAKAVFNIAQTDTLIERLVLDKPLRRLCGWGRLGAVPSESTFSRAFGEFAASALPGRLHEAVIAKTQGARLVGHISRDATAIEARERAPRRRKPRPGPSASAAGPGRARPGPRRPGSAAGWSAKAR